MKSAFLNELDTKDALVKFILKAKKLSMGEQVVAFEKEFAVFQGVKNATLVNSGGSANLAMLQALKNLGRLKDGDKIGFSALTWSTNVMPILQLGMQPVPIDCDQRTLNVMASNLKKRLNQTDLRAFFVTNALGFAGDLDVIRKVCNEAQIILIEDNCEALGTELPSGKTGNFGIMSSFSFFVAHHMSTVEGGMICTNDGEIDEMLRIVRANGWDRNLSAPKQHRWRKKYNINSEFEAKYTFYDLGYNIRPTEITGFLGRYQLKFLKENIAIRQRNYLLLESIVKDNPDLQTLDRSHISVLSNFAFPVLCKTPQLKCRYMKLFSNAGIETRPIIAGNIQRQPFYKKYILYSYELPDVDFVHDRGFYCGNYPELNKKDIKTLTDCLKRHEA
ncbi:MAG: DegT/DnrJ/EryC1/StrS family aminotransferase [Candidatus Omnitrophota bacterium]